MFVCSRAGCELIIHTEANLLSSDKSSFKYEWVSRELMQCQCRKIANFNYKGCSKTTAAGKVLELELTLPSFEPVYKEVDPMNNYRAICV